MKDTVDGTGNDEVNSMLKDNQFDGFLLGICHVISVVLIAAKDPVQKDG